jgi:hypothetical protein
MTRLIYEDKDRTRDFRQGIQGLAFIDPRGDTPVEYSLEKIMDQIGARTYLMAMALEFKQVINPHPMTMDEWQCRRAFRIMWRGLPDYKGERFIQ